jgi:transcriptional regulator with XRE-family HTH domain
MDTKRLIALQKSIGEAFHCSRRAMQLSQEAVAAKLGMHRTYYSAIERGEKNLTLATLLRICSVYQISIHVLFRDLRTEF